MSYSEYHQVYKSDPYFQKEYMSCYLKEGDEVFDFTFEEGDQFFKFRSIKSPIRKVGDDILTETWYDLESVYGYGGYIVNSTSSEFVNRALDALKQRCVEERIIAHFMRFHPLNSFIDHHASTLDFHAPNRKVIFVEACEKDEDSLMNGYASSLRRNIRKARKLGLEVRPLEASPAAKKKFQELYYATMDRKNAAALYYFDDTYFDRLFQLKELRVFGTYLGDQLISMITTLDSGKGEVYYHLGATDGAYYSYNPNPLILHEIALDVAQKNGSFLFLGGGNSNDLDDPLFKFKSKFCADYREFYIGGSIFIPEVFKELREKAAALKGEPIPLFLSYRFV